VIKYGIEKIDEMKNWKIIVFRIDTIKTRCMGMTVCYIESKSRREECFIIKYHYSDRWVTNTEYLKDKISKLYYQDRDNIGLNECE